MSTFSVAFSSGKVLPEVKKDALHSSLGEHFGCDVSRVGAFLELGWTDVKDRTLESTSLFASESTFSVYTPRKKSEEEVEEDKRALEECKEAFEWWRKKCEERRAQRELLEEKVTQLSEEIEGLRLIHLENSERALRQLR